MQKKIVIVGGHEQACNILNYINDHKLAEVVLCICRQDDIGVDTIFPSLLKRARESDVSVLQPRQLNTPKILSFIEQLDADLVLSLQNNMIFGRTWIDLFQNKLGIANVHYAPLPKYAGYWPEMWAIWNEEKEFAVTLHYITTEIDTGPIISQRFFKITEYDNRYTLYTKSSNECFLMLTEYLSLLLERKLSAIDQDHKLRSYYPKSLPNDGFMDLNWDEKTQKRFIRAIAFPGFPGPKIKIGDFIYTMIADDLPFFNKIQVKPNE